MKFPQSYVNLLRKISHYDVVSFDIFDTAVHRIVTNPEDVFLILGEKFGIPNFRELRINAEKLAREKAFKDFGVREVTIFDIYKEFNKFSSINIEEAIKAELSVEKKICYANPYIKYIYDCLREQGKIVVFASNMYLNHDLMHELLAKCGYDTNNIFVSCDYRANKREGALFKIIKSIYKEKKILHIGDDYAADVAGPIKVGIDGHQYERSTNLNKKINIGQASYLGSSIYNAIVNNYLNNKFTTEEKIKRKTLYKHGFKYGGPFVLGYVTFIHDYAISNGIEKICFLSRDGDFLQKIYNYVYKDKAVPNEYLLWSRRVAMSALPSSYMMDIFDSVIVRRLRAGTKIEYSEACNRLGIEPTNREINKCIDNETIESLKEEFLSNSKKLDQAAERTRQATIEYLKKIFDKYRKVALVDIGWRASGALSINQISSMAGLNVQLTALVAGNYAYKSSYDAIYDKTGFIVPYLFSDTLNREIAIDFQKSVERIIPLVEIFCASSTSPSFEGFSLNDNGEIRYKFGTPEVENYPTIDLIHAGELDFVKEYISRTKDIQTIAKLRGNDIYWFLKNGLNNKTLIKDLQNYTYPRFVDGSTKELKIDSLGEFWK